MKKALAGIATTVIAGVLVWWLTEGTRPQPSPEPPAPSDQGTRPQPSPEATAPSTPRVLSFLERAAGVYSLSSWTPASRPVELGARVVEGSLQLDPNGVADWSVLAEQTYTADPGKVRITARGNVQLGPQPSLVGVRDGAFASTHYLDSKWGQISSDVELALRGWTAGGQEDGFTVSLDAQAGERQVLQMVNSRGTFSWIK